jgi:Raf kinase inhibitor-like YbhB/YbcL family protein
MKTINLRVGLILLLLLVPSCQALQSGEQSILEEGVADMSIQVGRSAFADGEAIPRKYTCDGENLSPPLSWSGVPQGTQSLALVLNDPDAPRGDWVHWVLVDLPPDMEELPEGAQGGGVEGVNDFGKRGYGGPCPPKGSNHRYYFKLYALDKALNLKAGMTRADAEKAMQGYILAQGQLMGRYSR